MNNYHKCLSCDGSNYQCPFYSYRTSRVVEANPVCLWYKVIDSDITKLLTETLQQHKVLTFDQLRKLLRGEE